MRTPNQHKLKKIQQHCRDISQSFEKLSLELSELVDEESGDETNKSDVKACQIPIAKIEDEVFEDLSCEEATRLATRVAKSSSEIVNKLFKPPSSKFKIGDTVKITNHYKGRYGDLYGKQGEIHKIGKSFILLKLEGIPVLQQRAEDNIEFVSRIE